MNTRVLSLRLSEQEHLSLLECRAMDSSPREQIDRLLLVLCRDQNLVDHVGHCLLIVNLNYHFIYHFPLY